MKKTNTILILGFILFFGLFLRFYHLGNQSYWMDEGYTINAVISGTQNGYVNGSSILDSGEKYFCPLYCYPTAQIAQVAGQNAWSYRFLSAFFGLFFILLTYFLTKTIFKNQKAALLSSFFVAFSYWQIAWSQQARWYTMLEVFFWLALLLFYLFIKAKNNKQRILNFSLSILFTLLAIATHKLAYILPMIMLAWYLLEGKLNKKNIIISGLALVAVLIFAEFGLGLHFIAHAIQNVSLNYNLPYYLSFYLRNYWPFILIGIFGYFNAEKEQKKQITLIALPFLIYLVFLSFFSDIVHYRYLFHTTVAFYIIGAIVAIDITDKIKHSYLKTISWFLFVLVFFITGEGVIFPKNFYFLEADDPSQFNRPYYAYTPQPDFNLAYAKIKENLKPDEIVISSHPHFNKIFLNQPGYWIRYDYLGMEDTNKTIKQNKEYYVNAEVINNLDELKNITNTKHGYIIFDYMAIDGKISPDIVSYIQNNLKLFFSNEKNSYSKIWVYQF
ncbi:MAG: glycosyltransferase family 39 protein [Candidatus Falkowbacteria bacterium]